MVDPPADTSRQAPVAPIDYRMPPPAHPWRQVVGWIVAFGMAVLVVIALLLPSFGRAREPANRVKCASNLRQIGHAVLLHAIDHPDQPTPDIFSLLNSEHIAPSMLICPSSRAYQARGPEEQDTASMTVITYAWAGTASPQDLTADMVLAFDLEHHQPKDGATGAGVNVLLGDGSVIFVDAATADALWNQFMAGVRPLRLPGGQSPE